MEIESGPVQVPVDDGYMRAHAARPKGQGSYPAVVVVHEAFGLNAHIAEIADRLAAEGYVTLAPHLYHREGNGVAGYDDVEAAMRLMATLRDETVVRDMSAAVRYLQRQPHVRHDRVGVTGFCMGGRIAFLTACLNPAIRAAVPFYGGGIGRTMPLGGRVVQAPLDHAGALQAPLLLFFGEDDVFIPLDEVELIRQRLAELAKDAETIVYPGAPHGFFSRERESYRDEAAQDAWSRMLAFFARHLQA